MLLKLITPESPLDTGILLPFTSIFPKAKGETTKNCLSCCILWKSNLRLFFSLRGILRHFPLLWNDHQGQCISWYCHCESRWQCKDCRMNQWIFYKYDFHSQEPFMQNVKGAHPSSVRMNACLWPGGHGICLNRIYPGLQEPSHKNDWYSLFLPAIFNFIRMSTNWVIHKVSSD